RFGRTVEKKNLAEIAGRSVEASGGSAGESCDLVGDRFDQFGVIFPGRDLKNLTLVTRACQQVSVLIEGQRVNQVVARSPQACGRSVGSEFVDFGAPWNPGRRTVQHYRRLLWPSCIIHRRCGGPTLRWHRGC